MRVCSQRLLAPTSDTWFPCEAVAKSLLKINQKPGRSPEFIDGVYWPVKIKGWRARDPNGPIEGVSETVGRVLMVIIDGPSLAGIWAEILFKRLTNQAA
jgi:hypothetical protein